MITVLSSKSYDVGYEMKPDLLNGLCQLRLLPSQGI